MGARDLVRRAAGRLLRRVRGAKGDAAVAAETAAIRDTGLFDGRWYLQEYPDVAAAAMDPAEHYARHGAREGRYANEVFDSGFYLQRYPDVDVAGINPLLHYARDGWRELRDPSKAFSTAWYWFMHLGGRLDAGNPMLNYFSEGKSAALSIAPSGSIKAAPRRRIDVAIELLLSSGGMNPDLCSRIGEFLVRNKLWAHAEPVYRRLIAMQWDDARNHERLAAVLGAQGRWWQQVESLSTAIEIDPSNAGWHYKLGLAYQAMERWMEAAEAFGCAARLGMVGDEVHYRLGYALEHAGDPGAQKHYTKAISLSSDAAVLRFGVGALHESHRYWEDAASAYSERSDEPIDAQLHYRLGMAHDRCYRWREAELSYRIANAMDVAQPYWRYRLGFVLERQGKWPEAAEAYRVAMEISDRPRPYWQYRHGYVLMRAGEYLLACQSFLGLGDQGEDQGQDGPGAGAPANEDTEAFELVLARITHALEKDSTRPELSYAYGRRCEDRGDWQKASEAYKAALERQDEHRPSWYRRLGFAYYKLGEYRKACETLYEARLSRGAYGVDSSKLEKQPLERLLLSYNHYVQDLPIREKTIVYESFGGVAMGCNPLAIFRRLLASGEYREWTHVWILDEKGKIPKEYRGLGNVIFVRKESDLYLRYVATASHLVNNSTFPSWFVRRNEQKYLNTWHGTPLKTLGKDIKGNFMELKNTARNFLHATHIISPNPHTTHVLVDRYDVAGILSAQVAETGYPRADLTLNASEAERSATRKGLGLADDLPVVLYAPTWRGTLGDAVLDGDQLKAAIAGLAGLDCQVVFRGHYFSEKLLAELDLPVVIAPYGIDTSELLAITDVLVTDYSSILFDYLPLRKPIVYFAYDRDQYTELRGLYFRMDEMPGVLCGTAGELINAVGSAIQGAGLDVGAYDRAIEKFCSHDDGHATERAVAFFMDDAAAGEMSVRKDRRKALLFYAGAFPPNGITTSCLNLLSALDPSIYRIVVAIDADAIEQFQVRMENFGKIPEHVQIIARVGRMLTSPEERWLVEGLRVSGTFPSPEMWDIYLDVHAREFRRMFGASTFDGVVQFDGYSMFWSAVMLGADDGTVKVMYLHNDMRAEAELKFPSLRGLFRLYRDYDALVSVSEAMSWTNRQKLSQAYGIEGKEFTFAENVIVPEAILDSAESPLDADLAGWIQAGTTFMAMGRMSPEKDHAKLIRAFKRVVELKPGTRLLLLGDGPLRGDLEHLVQELELGGAVLFAGQRSNPFPALKACGCFVLSSNHEGQPMVLLEAMVLRKPIIATDIDGNRGAMAGRGGMLVENSEEGLASGMIQFIDGGLPAPALDGERYRLAALSHFDEIVSRKTH